MGSASSIFLVIAGFVRFSAMRPGESMLAGMKMWMAMEWRSISERRVSARPRGKGSALTVSIGVIETRMSERVVRGMRETRGTRQMIAAM